MHSVEEVFYDGASSASQELHLISDTGDISPSIRTSPCCHMWRTLRAIGVPVMQSNRYGGFDTVFLPVLESTLPSFCLSYKMKVQRGNRGGFGGFGGHGGFSHDGTPLKTQPPFSPVFRDPGYRGASDTVPRPGLQRHPDKVGPLSGSKTVKGRGEEKLKLGAEQDREEEEKKH